MIIHPESFLIQNEVFGNQTNNKNYPKEWITNHNQTVFVVWWRSHMADLPQFGAATT